MQTALSHFYPSIEIPKSRGFLSIFVVLHEFLILWLMPKRIQHHTLVMLYEDYLESQ